MNTHEPCQVRKEAALSGLIHVPWDSLTRANDKSNAYVRQSKRGARHKYANTKHLSHKMTGAFFYEIFYTSK